MPLPHGAGYDVDQAIELASIWGIDQNLSKVKAGAVMRCPEGRDHVEELLGAPVGYTIEGPVFGPDRASDYSTQLVGAAFYGAGFDADQAAELAEIWETDELEATIEAGRLILVGEQGEVEGLVGTPDFPEF